MAKPYVDIPTLLKIYSVTIFDHKIIQNVYFKIIFYLTRAGKKEGSFSNTSFQFLIGLPDQAFQSKERCLVFFLIRSRK